MMQFINQLAGTGAKSCKAPVKSSAPTNQQAGFPSCRPTNSLTAVKGRCCWFAGFNWATLPEMHNAFSKAGLCGLLE